MLLLCDLYALNADNKVFLSTRFLAATPEELTAPYRRIIRQVFNPDRGMPSLQLGAARKALNDFKGNLIRGDRGSRKVVRVVTRLHGVWPRR